MYEQYVADPSAVAESWREFFEDYTSVSTPVRRDAPTAPAPTGEMTAGPAPAPAAPAQDADAAAPAPAPAPAAAPAPAPAAATAPEPADEPGELIKGVGAAIVKNMSARREVPTATSFRDVPAKVLEVNR